MVCQPDPDSYRDEGYLIAQVSFRPDSYRPDSYRDQTDNPFSFA